MIADLNAYYAFVASLKQPRMAEEFSNLKMLGQVYIVADAKDLAQIIRDVTRYGGTYRPEDLYEFIQRRADWKKIEKTVDNVSPFEYLAGVAAYSRPHETVDVRPVRQRRLYNYVI